MKFLGHQDAWRDITRDLNKRKGAIYAAVSYLGPDATRIMPLREGDVLVCDASDRSISAGSTNPHALIEYIKAGVDVYSRENLHSKVIVGSRTAWIGSANASSRSENVKIEAVIKLSDSEVVTDALLFVLELTEEAIPITLAHAKSLIFSMPKKTSLDPLEIPKSSVLWSCEVGPEEDATPAEIKRYESHLRNAKSQRSSIGSRSKLHYMESSFDCGFKVSDWVLRYDQRDVFAPLVVVGAFASNRRFCYYLASARSKKSQVKRSSFEKDLKFELEDDLEYSLQKSSKILAYFASEK